MGDYNPYAPYILGQEWVPIRDEDMFLSPIVNSTEVGHGFTLAASRTLQDCRFYVNKLPQTAPFGEVMQISVYPANTEDQTGPIKSVVIPVGNGGITGNAFINSASTVAEALESPADSSSITLSGGVPDDANLDVYFATNQYSQLLNGKRILAVNMIYVATASYTNPDDFDVRVKMTQPPNASYIFFGDSTDIVTVLAGPGRPEYQRLSLGEVTPFWSTNPFGTNERLPWTFATLQRFEFSSANRITVRWDAIDNASNAIFLQYIGLEVIYCEERRLVVAGQAFGGSNALTPLGGVTREFILGANAMPARDPITLALNPSLAIGQYDTVISSPSMGALSALSQYPVFNGLRQLYALPPHPGVQVNIPFPLPDHLDETFTTETTQVLPQLSLHTSGGPVNEVHVYGRQVAAQVYGSITAIQEIDDDNITTGTYQQVRFYARRFGDTTVPLTLTGLAGLSGSTVSITPTDFDALDEIINGWREVTLTFTTAPTMGGGTPNWSWAATGELAGNRWEVLGASAPALSGIPGNNYNLVPSNQQLYTATYLQPNGGVAELDWVPQGIGSPPVSGNGTGDDSSDAVLIFSQNPLPITGFTVSTRTQTMTGIGLDCGVDPCCIPTGIIYNRLTWGLPVNTGVASDNFNRTVAAGGWGTASDGKTWTTSGTAANFSVDGAEGIITPTATASDRIAWVNVGGPEQDVQALVRIADTAETSSLNIGLVARLTDASNYYSVELRQNSTGTLTLMIRKRVAGVATDLLSMTVASLNASTTAWRYLRFQVQGTILRAKVWGVDEDEPGWMLTVSDTSLTTGNNAGAFARDNTTAAAPSSFMFDNFSVGPPDYGFGAYELQRMDTVDTDWQTIMKATGVATTGFSDFEARVGISSTYRIRGLNVYDFAGPWSSTVSITIPSPGASGGCIDEGHILLFTSNERQDGSINLAYSSVWMDRVQEDFTFPESGFVQLQAMYNRNFFTAFRPTERGGEQFQRTLLVQAAAISPPTLADFTSLRDMAWEDVSYICVRDEDGNRWFATILVPGGRVLNSRKLYLAPVTVIEVTDTPSEADPS